MESIVFDWFKERVYHHFSIAQRLHKFDDFQEAPDLLEDVLDTEIEILKFFGLPEVSEFMTIIDLFSWRDQINDNDIEELFVTLKETAKNYLLTPAKTDKRILIEAREAHLTAYDFFPMMGIEVHNYNIFLYEYLFYSKCYDVDVILQEMKKGNEIPRETVIKMNSNLLLKGKLNTEVQHLGLSFWKEFVENKRNENRTPNKETIRQIDIICKRTNSLFPGTFSFDNCYIGSLKYLETQNQYVSVRLITTLDLNLLNIYVLMPFEKAISILKKSTNHSIASLARSMLYENINQNSAVTDTLLIRKRNNTYLYCVGVNITVVKCDFEVNGVASSDHNYYELK